MIGLKKKPRHYLLHIKDKIILSDKRFCPPHYFPHKMPFGPKVVDEPCHLHKARWRMGHHKPFCRLLRCPNYRFMDKKDAEYKKKGSIVPE